MAQLRAKSGPLTGQAIEFTDEVVIGRENADVTIDDAEISRRHVVVRWLGGAVEVEDLGSSNGTFVDDQRIEGPTRVGGGARIRLGTTVLEVEGVPPVPAEEASAVADPQATKARPIADVEATKARPIADVETTKARPIADVETTKARPIADVEATKARPIADVEATRTRPIADVEATRARPVAEPQGTRARSIPVEAGPTRSPAPPAPSAPPPSRSADASGTLGLPANVGQFSPPARKRSRGLASRSWVPVALSFGTVIVVAAALVIYFASR